MEYSHKQTTEILKFIAKYPFEEILFNDDDVLQIMKVDYAGQEVTLRDFCEYTIEEILETKGFRDKKINAEFKAFLKNIEL